MAVSLAQYVDLLVKKLYGVAKTDDAVNKSPSNESIPSPPLLRGDIVWMQSGQIPSTAQVVSGITQSYLGGSCIQCSPDTTTVPIGGVYPTWLTNLTNWIPQEFGSTWPVKIYVDNPGAANAQATGTQIFGPGIAGTGEFFFDTQAGLLNFIGDTIPATLTSGKVIYVAGYRYVGLLGVTNIPSNSNIGNLVIANTTITTNQTNGNIILTATGNGIVEISGTAGIEIPVGNTAQRPSPAVAGTLRFNSGSNTVEIYTGTSWQSAGGTTSAITNQTINPDGSTATYTLDQSASAAGILVTINGINQTPGVDYTVVTDQITFTTTPLVTDIIQVRFISLTTTVTEVTNSSGTTAVSTTDTPTIDFILSSNTVAQITSAKVFNIAGSHSLQLPVYTVAQANGLSNVATGQTIYVSNGDSGNPCLAVYSGGVWKRVSFGATIST